MFLHGICFCAINEIIFFLIGKPPSTRVWLVQCVTYVILMFIMKIIITLLMQFSFWENVRDLMLSPIPNPYLELAIVMLIIPLFVNVSIVLFLIINFYFFHICLFIYLVKY